MAMAGPSVTTTAHTAFRWPMPMAELDRLRLTQILSPAFPIGAFAHSQGLEWAIASGRVTDGPELQGWIEAVLCHGSGHSDAVFLSLARRPDADLALLAELYAAYLPSVGRALEAGELGRGFVTLTDPKAEGRALRGEKAGEAPLAKPDAADAINAPAKPR